ncbi:preprotein translocase subunit YajC [Bifidobacterium sp. 82T24]|uniref:preprotein translocase subunit YajC n=1 Tax=Bifidobacterium pluvialisilvae TaxID=2834436 RepID=UPI001C587FE8|nr:preprotein translocase subunit YajC [Bifidobacterium pluvialisilvae]MBW3088118.1 preprotein translocase subunit YajC [Bifidobacterium pluvialisilvae]
MGGNSNTMMLIAIIVVIGGMMWYQSRQSKKQKGKVEDFRSNLKKGDSVATYSGLIGTIEEVDLDIDQVVVNSEGSLSRWRIQAITEPPVVPNYVSDEEFEQEKAAGTESDEKPSSDEGTADEAPKQASENDVEATESKAEEASDDAKAPAETEEDNNENKAGETTK